MCNGGDSFMAKLKDLTGKTFGRLTVIERYDDYVSPSGQRQAQWVCECSCDQHNIIIVRGSHLKTGRTTSCGCVAKEMIKERNITHGRTKTRLYNIWNGIKKRCYNVNDPKYNNYGGRGIAMCDEWKDSFIEFQNWAINSGYCDDLTIDRIDNDGNYEPCNCRWANFVEQNNNRRSNKNITFNGETHNLRQWCIKLSLPYNPIQLRLSRGWTVEEAFTTPVNTTNYNS